MTATKVGPGFVVSMVKAGDGRTGRVVEGARHLSPHLGERMRAIQLFGRSIFIRELLPQDLKIELQTLTRAQAMNLARFLANVVGKAHARQLDADTQSKWAQELGRARTGDLKAPSWLWSSVVDLLGRHIWSTVGTSRWRSPIRRDDRRGLSRRIVSKSITFCDGGGITSLSLFPH
jgi:uncharacterized protein (DUF2252 family)